MNSTKHTLVVLVADKPGVLNRVASLFRRRGFNIESIAVGHTEQEGVSRMTIVASVESETPGVVDQSRKQLEKLVDVLYVRDITDENIVARELALIKVKATRETRSEIMQIVEIFRANIVDVASSSLTVEVTGDKDKIDSLCNLLKDFHIIEMARTGLIALTRGEEMKLLIDKRETTAKVRGILIELAFTCQTIQAQAEKPGRREYDSLKKPLDDLSERYELIKEEFSIVSKEFGAPVGSVELLVASIVRDLNTVLKIDLTTKEGKERFDKGLMRIGNNVQECLKQLERLRQLQE